MLLSLTWNTERQEVKRPLRRQCVNKETISCQLKYLFIAGKNLGTSTCEPCRKVSFVYLLWLFEMFLDLSGCLTLGKTDQKTIKEAPHCKEQAWPVAALGRHSEGGHREKTTYKHLRPASPTQAMLVLPLCTADKFTWNLSRKRAKKVCFCLHFNLPHHVPFCLKERILNIYTWRPSRGPPGELRPVRDLYEGFSFLSILWERQGLAELILRVSLSKTTLGQIQGQDSLLTPKLQTSSCRYSSWGEKPKWTDLVHGLNIGWKG